MKQHQTNSFISRAAAMLLTVIIAFAGAQTAGAQVPEPKPCNVKFDISGEGTVEFLGETVTNDQTIDCTIPFGDDLIITPETGYVVSSVTVTYGATDELNISLNQDDDFLWSLHIHSYEGSEPPTITVHIVFDKALAGGADEASAVALTADDDLSHLAGGWYKVESDLTLGHTVNLHGDTHIIIASGKTLTVSTSDKYGISGSALTVSGEGALAVSASKRAIYVDNYTQMGCAVTLSGSSSGLHAKNNVSISGGSLTTSGATYGIYTDKGAITISGGTVSSSGKQCGLFAARAMNIMGGTVSASGDNYGIRGYSVSITGGQVTASSGGIMSNYGDITLGWTSATDYITASGYVLQNDGFYVKIADGQTLYGGGFPSASYTGTVDDPSALNGLMLRPTAAVTESGTNEYTIRYADGWDAFCDRLAADDGKAFFSGKTVLLDADIIVSRMAGGQYHDFQGTFDGQGHTLTFNYGEADKYSTESYIAPFRNVESGCIIENLHVSGDIYTTGKYAAGIVCSQYGTVTIRNCRSSVIIRSSVSGDGTHGGLVANNNNSGTLTIEGCLFDGKILTTGATATTHCGGFVGWRANAVTITNSLYAPAALADGETEVQAGDSNPSATFARNGATITNSYYTRTLGTAQGKACHCVTAGDEYTTVAVALTGTATQYTVSGITAYKDGETQLPGLKYGDALYAGSEETVSLTLSTAGEAPAGYHYTYAASNGTLSGGAGNSYTLTMPDEDVTISNALRSTGSAVSVAYVDENGDTQHIDAIALDGTESVDVYGKIDLTAGAYYVGTDINYTNRIQFTNDAILILGDGATMTVNYGNYDVILTDNNLTICGQTLGTGKLNATSTNGGYAGISVGTGNLTINGGTVTANGGNGNGIHVENGNVTINGGNVTATGVNCGIWANNGNVTINGGNVTANGRDYGIRASGIITIDGGNVTANGDYGISADGKITLGWTNASDRIFASSFYIMPDIITINDGQTLTDAYGNHYYGYLPAEAISCKHLYPYIETLDLAANQAPDQNYWTTFYCGHTDYEIDAVENACAYTATYADGKLTLHNQGKQIPKATAVIIVADNSEVSMTAATLDAFTGSNDLRGVDVDTPVADITSDLGNGTLYVLGMTTVNNEQHFGFHRYTGTDMAAHKAFVHVAGSSSNARALTMVFGEETGIDAQPMVNGQSSMVNAQWYTLDGRRLTQKPTQPGLYINKGMKVVIK